MKRYLPPLLGIVTLVSAQNEFPVVQAPPVPLPEGAVSPPPSPSPSPGGAAGITINRGRPGRRTEIRTSAVAEAQAQAQVQAAADRAPTANVRRERIELDLPRTTKSGRTLVVQSSDPDPVAMGNLEEDLSVMALILRKATGGTHGDDKRMALGIEVDSSVFGSASGARNIYLEGHGAMFLLAVPFPLIAPPEKPPQARTKEKAESDWAQAREELLNAERSRLEVQLDRIWVGNSKAGYAEFDAAKVESLTEDILHALKNVTHIRGLKVDEFVTVVIQGAETIRGDKWVGKTGAGRSGKSDSRRGETVMTLRVRRSDAEAFSSGVLDFEGFRKKVTIQTYFRRGDSPVGTATFLGPNP